MFPPKQKIALVKKEMRVLQSLVAPDLDAHGMLEPARFPATQTVVCKTLDTPASAATIAHANPGSQQAAKVRH
ncbi:16S rRNA m(2)G1516 methyltransferase [Escherichia coli]|nr:16S rRNA m(2)G1516 methyltransferase [Escherichia coli]